MAIRQLPDFERSLSIASNLRLYPVVQETSDRTIFLNVFRSYKVPDEIYNNESLFEYYTVQPDDWFDDISNVHYGTPYLWWLVALFNDFTNPYESLVEGDVIRVLKQGYTYQIFDDIAEIEGL